MNKDALLLLVLALALLIGMLLTLRWGGGSRHGYGALPPAAMPYHVCFFKQFKAPP